MGPRQRAIAWLSGAVLLAACGGGTDRAAAPETDDADERPCPEVIESLDEANRIRAETFGSGPEGREAMAMILATVQERPDCFGDEEVEFAAELAESLPSEAQAEAIEAAEDACDEPGGELSTSGPGDVTYDSPEQALTDRTGLRPEGVAERSFEGDGRVEFDYHDDAGNYQGWVMVEQAEAGWSVRWAISCGADAGQQ